MIHDLKTIPEYYEAVRIGKKNFEVRKNDRDYKVGDALSLQEYDPVEKRYTGRSIGFTVIYILDNPEFVKEGYVIMGLGAVTE